MKSASRFRDGGVVSSRSWSMGPNGVHITPPVAYPAYRVGSRWAVGEPAWTPWGWIHDYLLTKEDIDRLLGVDSSGDSK